MSRFILDLQEANLVTVRVNSNDPLHFSGSRTPSFVQSQFGTAINPNLELHELDEDLQWDLDIEEEERSEPERSAAEDKVAEQNARNGVPELHIAGPSSQV